MNSRDIPSGVGVVPLGEIPFTGLLLKFLNSLDCAGLEPKLRAGSVVKVSHVVGRNPVT